MILVWLTRAASAATLEVGIDFPTIQDAIDAASDGDIIHIPAGTWAEAIDLGNLAITLRGDGAGVTLLSPGTSEDVVTMSSSRVAAITDLTIAPAGGTGIRLERGELSLDGVTIDGGGSSTSRGGGIYADGAELELIDVTFTGSTAAYGGHLYLTGGSAVTGSAVEFTGGTAATGGAIYADDASTILLIDVIASGAYASGDGGFAYLDSAEFSASDLFLDTPTGRNTSGVGFYVTGHGALMLADSSISGAEASGWSSGYAGGAIWLGDGSVAQIDDSTFSSNTAYSGGAVYLENAATARFSNVRFEDNVADAYGGGLYVSDGAEVECESCVFASNTADSGGGAMVATRATFLDTDGTFTDNQANDSGGGLAMAGSAEVQLEASIFSGNAADADGGAIFGAGEIEGNDVTFSGNVSRSGDGGAIGGAAELALSGATFDGNEARLGSGGAVGTGGDTSLESSRFTDNSANDSGGAVWSSAASLDVWEGTFFRNTADREGGAIATSAVATVSLARSYLHGNSAKTGGAVSLSEVSGSAILSNLRLTDNVASEDGGGVWLSGSVEIEVVNNTFAGNDGARDGGHLYTSTAVSLVNNILLSAADGGGTYGTDATTDRYYNLAWDNAGGDWSGWSDPTGVSGNVSVDPELDAYSADADETNDSLFLGVASPAIDAGSPVLFDVDGTRSDIGAFGGPDADVLDGDGDGAYDNVDCDDSDASVNRSATDIPYDGVDQDCSGSDESDVDGDGVAASVAGGDDCDDDAASVNPSAAEVWYDGIDQDCSGGSDYDQDGDRHDSAFKGGGDDCNDLDSAIHASAIEVWYDGIDQDCDGRNDYDRDKDGFISQDFGGSDCDDYNAARHPGNTEIPYDGIDQDCDGTDLVDVDGDGWVSEQAGGSDCNDAQASVYPGAAEDPTDGFDTDCDGFSEWDRDGDGFDDLAYGGGDCADFDAAINPDTEEIWYDGIDQDCDGRDDDQDGDGWLVADDCDDENPATHPGAVERWDGVDNDCDGYSEIDDRDGDGLIDLQEWVLGSDPEDPDTDGDTMLDGFEFTEGPDRDGDHLPDCIDTDDDSDGIASRTEMRIDVNGDDVPDTDIDGDGLVNAHDVDSDGDGFPDKLEGVADLDFDGVGDWADYQGDLVGGGCATDWAGVLLPGLLLAGFRRGRASGKVRRTG